MPEKIRSASSTNQNLQWLEEYQPVVEDDMKTEMIHGLSRSCAQLPEEDRACTGQGRRTCEWQPFFVNSWD